MLVELFLLLFLSIEVYSNQVDVKIKEVKPDYKVTKYTFEVEKVNQKDGKEKNSTETEAVLKMSPDGPPLQLIPLDFLCEFCQVVIIKLKQRQATESDFEEKIKEECKNGTDASLCDIINGVNIEKLKNDDPKAICDHQKMCNGVTQDTSSPGTAPLEGQTILEHIDVDSEHASEKDKAVRVVADNQNLNASIRVADIAPPY